MAAFLLIGAFLLAALAPVNTGRSAAQESAVESPGARFSDAFQRWRAGDESAAASARAIAAEMCSNLGRCEVPRIVEHYAALTREQRSAGSAIERRVSDLRTEMVLAHERGLRGEEWEAARLEIEAELEALWSASRDLADRGARAQISALRAEYRIARLEGERGPNFAAEDRAQLAQQIELDAREALADFEAFDIIRAALNPRSSLARTDHYVGRLSSARASYDALVLGARKVGDTNWMAEAYEGMLAIAVDRGDELERDRCLEELAGLRKAHEDWSLARAWAMRLIHADRAAEAREFLDQFQAPAPDLDSRAAMTTRRELAYVRALACLRLGELDKARQFAEEASRAPQIGFEQRFLEARIELASGKAKAAIALLGDPDLLVSLSARDAGAARALLGEAQLSLGNADGARRELEQALELADAERQRALVEPMLSTDDARRFNYIGEWEGAGLEAVAILARAHVALGDSASAALTIENWQSRSLRGDSNELAMLRARAGQGPLAQPLTAENLRAWASSTELGLVTWIFGADSGAVIHVKVSEDGRVESAGEALGFGREALREAVRRLRERASAGLETDSMAQALKQELLPAKVLAHIGTPRATGARLLVLLHGPMESLPVELLGLGAGLFDEELCLLVLPGLPAAEPGPPPGAAEFERWHLLGSPVDGAQSDGPARVLLPGAQAELLEIAALRAGAEITQGARFERGAVERALRSGACLHIATHLEVSNLEARSRFPAIGLRLVDGDVISARELADLRPQLPLAVLAACETGGGRYTDGEGLFGVARAFLEGGTRNLVVTLWPVEDGAARAFALEFHRALAGGVRPSAAARQARIVLRNQGISNADWAAFRFLGRD